MTQATLLSGRCTIPIPNISTSTHSMPQQHCHTAQWIAAPTAVGDMLQWWNAAAAASNAWLQELQQVWQPQVSKSVAIQLHSINSIQFNSIRFDSIRFDSIRFNSIQFNSIHMTGFSTSQHLTMYLEDSCPKLHSSQKEWYTPCWKAWVKRRSGSGYVCSSWDELGATCLIAFKVDNEFHIHVTHLTTLSLLWHSNFLWVMICFGKCFKLHGETSQLYLMSVHHAQIVRCLQNRMKTVAQHCHWHEAPAEIHRFIRVLYAPLLNVAHCPPG